MHCITANRNSSIFVTNLPDFRGASPAYLNNGNRRLANIINGDVISTGGADVVGLAASQIPTITSAVSVSVSGSVSVQSNQQFVVAGFGNVAGSGNLGSGAVVVSAGNFSGSSSGSATSNNTGGAARSNLQPTTVGGIRLVRAG